MRSAGKPFHAFMTLSAKKFDLTDMLLWCLKSLYGWPLVQLVRNSKKASRSIRTRQILFYSNTTDRSEAYVFLTVPGLTISIDYHTTTH